MGKVGLGGGTIAGSVPRRIGTSSAANVVDLPHRDMARTRLLVRALLNVLESLNFLDQFRVIDCGRSQRIEIDVLATILIPAGSREFLFELKMRHGPRTLLATDDYELMADFVRQYVHARLGENAELRELL